MKTLLLFKKFLWAVSLQEQVQSAACKNQKPFRLFHRVKTHGSYVISWLSQPETISVCWMNKAINEKSEPGRHRSWNGPYHWFVKVNSNEERMWCVDASGSDQGMASRDFLWKPICQYEPGPSRSHLSLSDAAVTVTNDETSKNRQ